MSKTILWEVIGSNISGGMKVREGRELQSRAEPTPLGTGSIIRQIRLEGRELQYERISGLGPISGWVSVRDDHEALVVRTTKECRLMPICMCFYTALNASQGRSQMNAWMKAARKEGLVDFVIGDQVCEEGYKDCRDFDDYTDRLVSKIDDDPSNLGRPVLIIAHAAGAVAAWGTAKKLGRRCLKLYVLSRRPPDNAVLDEVFNVDCAAKVRSLDDVSLFSSALDAWPNAMLQEFKDDNPDAELSPRALEVAKLFKELYGSHVVPCGSKDSHLILGGRKAISAPIMALAAEKENPQKGETPQKMQGWKSFTQRQNSFEVITVPGVDHMSIMWALSPAFDIILDDMKHWLASEAWMMKEKGWAMRKPLKHASIHEGHALSDSTCCPDLLTAF